MGRMVRMMAEYNVSKPEEIKGFEVLGYRYNEHFSDNKTFVYLK